MTMKVSKHLQISTVAIVFLVLVSAGCTEFEQRSSDYATRISTLEEKVNTISINMDNVNARSNDLAGKPNEVKRKTERGNLQDKKKRFKKQQRQKIMHQAMKQQLALTELNKSKINSLEGRVGTLSNSIENLETKSNDLASKLNEVKKKTERSNLQEKTTETKNTLQGMKQQLALTESNKNKINTLEKKFGTLTSSLESSDTKNNNLARQLGEMKKGTDHSSLQEELLGTKKSIQEIKQQLTSLETDKDEIKTKLGEQESLYAKSFNIINNIEELTASIKETQKKENSSHTLSDKAIELYSAGNFEDAISYWEETLKLDPTNLEAKFNIEIAKDRLRVKEIQEDLKALRVQKGKVK